MHSLLGGKEGHPYPPAQPSAELVHEPYYWAGANTTGREGVDPLTQPSARLMSTILLGGFMGGLPIVSHMHTYVTQTLFLLFGMLLV